jgi:hypothetical protein
MDLARSPRRSPLTARKKGSGYENGSRDCQLSCTLILVSSGLNSSLVPRRFVVPHRRATRTRDDMRGRKWTEFAGKPHHEIDKINPRGPRKGRASHRTTHSAWVRGRLNSITFKSGFLLLCLWLKIGKHKISHYACKCFKILKQHSSKEITVHHLKGNSNKN